jgi:NAD+ diphosphatase
MRNAKAVTFGGSGLDRAAHLRDDTDAIAALLQQPDARILPIWRGKLPVTSDERTHLWFVGNGHSALDDAAEPPFFVGLDDGYPVFAADISAWQPQNYDAEAAAQFFDPTIYEHPTMEAGGQFCELRGFMARLSPRQAEIAAAARGLISWHQTHGFCAKCGAASHVSQAGWQRACPNCKAMHFPRTDPVVIMLILHGNDVLLGRSPGWPDKMYSLLAGFMEPGETMEAAVRREVLEEANIVVGDVSYLASQPWPFPASLMIGCLGQAKTRDITIDPLEIEDAIWVSRERMLEVVAGNDDGLFPARKGSIAHFLVERWLQDSLT